MCSARRALGGRAAPLARHRARRRRPGRPSVCERRRAGSQAPVLTRPSRPQGTCPSQDPDSVPAPDAIYVLYARERGRTLTERVCVCARARGGRGAPCRQTAPAPAGPGSGRRPQMARTDKSAPATMQHVIIVYQRTVCAEIHVQLTCLES